MRLLLPALVALVAFATFAPLTSAQFTGWDDDQTLDQNPRLKPPTWGSVGYYWTTAGDDAPMGLYVPVTYTVWAAAAGPYGGPRADVVHRLNAGLHAVTAGLVMVLLRRFVPAWPAAAGALVFALHPVQVESVAWASGTKDLLCGMFSVAAIWAATDGRPAVRWAGFFLFVLATLSKPTAMVVPLTIGAVDWLAGKPLWRRWPWWVWAVACGAWAHASQPVPWAATLPVWTRPVVALDAVAFYLGKLVWPAGLCIDYGRNPRTLMASTAVRWTWAVPVGVFFALRLIRPGLRKSFMSSPAGTDQKPPLAARRADGRRSPNPRPADSSSRTDAGTLDGAVLGSVWFVAPLLPVLGFLPFDFQYVSTVADHYLYLPMAGVGLFVATLLHRGAGRLTKPLGAIVLALLAVWAVVDVRQERTWADTRALAGRAVAVNPRSFVGHDLLGSADFVTGNHARDPGPWYDRAIAHYRAALAADPLYVNSLANLALVQRKAGRTEGARASLRRLVEIQPSLPPGRRMDPGKLARMWADFGAGQKSGAE